MNCGHEVTDLLDRHPVVRQQRDKCVAQLARRPLHAEARSPADRPERPAHIRGIKPRPERWLADYLATGMAPIATLAKIHKASGLVGDTGIEPVTSSV